MLQIQRILAPVDLSDASRHALENAAVLARWYSARITVLHVFTPVMLPMPGPAIVGLTPGALLDQADGERLSAQVKAFASEVIPEAVPFDVIIDTGAPARCILEQAAALSADLIVLGTHGLGGFEHLMVGSVTEKVLRKATCPVLTVPPRAGATSTLPFKRLLCPVDFSEPSLMAARTALRLAEEADAAITLVHVLEGPDESEPIASRSFNVPEYRRLREQQAAADLTALIPADARDWCQPTQRLAYGKPYREILRLAEEGAADLIVMGVHGRNPVDVALFGSTTNQIVRRARCPVLTLRAPSAASPDLRRQAPEWLSLSA